MIHILLTILKIIGILLLCVLGILLLIALIVLFWPIRYLVTGKLDENNKNLQVRITWLFRIVSLRFQYPSEDGLVIRIFGKKLNLNRESNSKKKTKMNTKQKGTSLKETDGMKENQTTQMKDEDVAFEEINDISLEESEEDMNHKKESLFVKIRNKIKEIWFKIKGLYAKIEKIKSILEQEETKLFFSDSLGRIKKIWKKLKPKVLRVYGTFGLGTPDLTGKAYGLYWAMKPYLSQEVELIPDFDHKVFEGNVYIKGRITIFVFILNGCKIYFDKRLKQLLNQWKADERGVNNNGKEQSV